MVDTGDIWRAAAKEEIKKETAHTDVRYATMLEEAVQGHIKTKNVADRADEEIEAARDSAEAFLLGVLEERGFVKLVRKYRRLRSRTPW